MFPSQLMLHDTILRPSCHLNANLSELAKALESIRLRPVIALDFHLSSNELYYVCHKYKTKRDKSIEPNHVIISFIFSRMKIIVS